MYKSRNKIVSKVVEKLLEYRIFLKDILTFLGFNYRDALFITFYTLSKIYLTTTGKAMQSYVLIGQF